MIQDIYDVSKGDRARALRSLKAAEAVRRAWLALEELEDAQAKREAKEYENRRRLKGGLAAFAVSVLGVGALVALLFVWGKR